MEVWILRYLKPRRRLGESRDLQVLVRSTDGQEALLETVQVELRDSPLHRIVRSQVGQGRTRLVLDLVHEARMDSNDLAQSLAAFKEASESGAMFVLANANPKVREIFRITHLDQAVTLFDSLDEAAEHLTR